MITASVNEKNRIELRGPYNDALQEWYHSLPGARWDKTRNCWQVHMTPACCWRIIAQCPDTVEAEEKIRVVGQRFYEPVLRPANPHLQPILRSKDAWNHQAQAYNFAIFRDATLLAMAMGTGKSLVTIQLAENWGCRQVLIMCPKAVMGVWRREFAKHAVDGWLVTILDKGDQKKKVATAILDATAAQARNLPWVCVVNYESAKAGAFAAWSSGSAASVSPRNRPWDLVVGDESHRFKGATSQVSKYMAELGQHAKRRLCLTGTPMAHSPLDLFGQFRFLDRGVFGDSYHRFRNMFAISGPLGADHIVGFKNQEELARRMSLITYEVGADVLDLPEATHIEIEIELDPKTRRMYDEMENDLIAFVDGGGEITAANGLVKLLRCQQMTGGHARLDDDTDRTIGTEKMDALCDLIADLDEPVVVACQFRHDLMQIKLSAIAEDRVYGEISGPRKDLTPNATMPGNVEVMGVQTASGGVGVDLTRARVMVIYSPGYALGPYEQLLARIHRPGQTRPVVYYHLVAKNTVDEAVYKALRSKRAVIDEVMSYLKGEKP